MLPARRTLHADRCFLILSGAVLMCVSGCAEGGRHLALGRPVTLRRGEGCVVPVGAAEWSVDSCVRVRGGQTYRFSTQPDALWWDWFTERKPDGTGPARWYGPYMRLWSRMLRVPGGTPFALYGQVGEGPVFFIGAGNRVTMSDSGALRFFANDVRGFYWNNRGSVDVSVSRVQKP